MKTVTAALLLLLSTSAMAGKIKVTDGDVAGLLSHEKVKVEYVYDGMIIGKKLTEDEYVAERVAEKNEKEAGSGDAWKEAWYGDRDKAYHPKFEELVNKYTKKSNTTFGRDIESPDLVMRVQVIRLEPGFYAYVAKRPAELDLEVTFYEPGKPDAPIATLTNMKSPGSPYPSVAQRVGESFAKAAKDLGKFLSKKAI